jgi:hypothetical protein
MKKLLLFGFLLVSLISVAQKQTMVSNDDTLYDGKNSIIIPKGDSVTVLSYENKGYICTYAAWRDFTGYIKEKNLVITRYMLSLVKLQQDTLRNHISMKAEEINELNNLKVLNNNDSVTYVYLHSKPFWVYDNISVLNNTKGFQGAYITFLNTSVQIIKSISFTVVPYNEANEQVTDNKDKNSMNCEILGPIGPEERATYENDILFSTTVISYYKLSNISVQYLDNTTKHFNFSDIKLKSYN